jgi:long-subunit fatty acid transport protein
VGNATHSSKFLRLDFAPTAAVDLGQYLSVGLGFVTSYIEFKSNILGFDEDGSGYGFTGQGGVLLKAHKRFKVGLNYRGPMNAKVNGSGTLAGVGTDNFSADFKFPGTLSLGLAWQLIDPLLIAFNFDWEMWSYVDKIRRNYTIPAHQAAGTTILDSKDSYDIRLGVAYAPWYHSEFRFGYSYVMAAVPAANIVPALPDFDIHIFSVGYSHYLKSFRFDVGYEFQHMPTRDSNSIVFPGAYEMRVHSFLIGVSYRFGGRNKT